MSCNNESTTPTTNDSTNIVTAVPAPPDTASAVVVPSCYAHQTSNNIVSLKLKTVRPNVSGELTYDFMGKDKSEGTITGAMHGDTLNAEYNSLSGGKRTVRQVVFLKRGTAFVEGSADSKDTLAFNGVILNEVPCTPR